MKKGKPLPPVSEKIDLISTLIKLGVLDPPDHPGPQAVLAHFDILDVVGTGGMGTVLLGSDRNSGRLCAIKVLKPHLCTNPEAIHFFLVEARHMKRLHHPNIIPVFEVSPKGHQHFFAMQYMEAGNLDDRIQDASGMQWQEIVKISKSIAQGLIYAHSEGIIHRDLKPANILLSPDGEAFISDFGLARSLFNDSNLEVGTPSCEGTAAYMSPGMASGEAEDTRCDIYSFGCILYEMLTGSPPYSGPTTAAIIAKILAGPPVPILKISPGAHPRLAAVAEKCMARKLKNRYAEMRDVLEDIHQLESRPIHPQKAWKKPAMLTAFSLLLALLILFPFLQNTDTHGVDNQTGTFGYQEDIGRHIKLWWSFDESGNELADLSGTGNMGQIETMGDIQKGAPGKWGTSWNFGSSSVYCAEPKGLPVGNAPRTIMAWVFVPEQTTPNGLIAGWGQGGKNTCWLSISYGSKLFWNGWDDGSTIGSTPIKKNAWQHVAATYDGRTRRLYIDGILDATDEKPFHTPASPFSAAGIATTERPIPDGAFQGRIDEIKIFDCALSPEQISEASKCDVPVPVYPAVFQESWDQIDSFPKDPWAVFGDKPHIIPYINKTEGNPPPSAGPGGGGHLEFSAMYHENLNMGFQNGYTIDFDFFISGSPTNHYTDLMVGIKEVSDNQATLAKSPAVLMTKFGKNVPEIEPAVMEIVVRKNGTGEMDNARISGEFELDRMNHAQILIRRSDRHCELFLNGEQVYISSVGLKPRQDCQHVFFVGGWEQNGHVWIDNIRICSANPE